MSSVLFPTKDTVEFLPVSLPASFRGQTGGWRPTTRGGGGRSCRGWVEEGGYSCRGEVGSPQEGSPLGEEKGEGGRKGVRSPLGEEGGRGYAAFGIGGGRGYAAVLTLRIDPGTKPRYCKYLGNVPFCYSWFHIKVTWSVHSFNGDYLSIHSAQVTEGTFFRKSPLYVYSIKTYMYSVAIPSQ